MKLHFVGTRGYVEEKSRNHRLRASLLIDDGSTRLLIDWGDENPPELLDKLKPDFIIITHAHPDHLFGLKNKEIKIATVVTEDTLTSDYYEEEDYKIDKLVRVHRDSTFRCGSFKVRFVPVLHSTKAPNVAVIVESGKWKICYASDVASIPKEYRDKYLRGCTLYIGDLSTHEEKGLVRKDKKRGDIIGHADIRTQMAWCRDASIKNIVWTHLGSKPIKMGDRKLQSYVNKLKDEYNILNCIVARDGSVIDMSELEVTPEDVKAITPKVTGKPQYGLYLVSPHAKLMWSEEKDLIVKTRRFEEHIGEPLYLIEDRLCYGVIRLKKPYEISVEEFKRLRDRHQITDEEYKKWGWTGKKLYAYEVEILEKYDPPRPVSVPKGVQVFVSAKLLKFRDAKELSDIELEYYHSICHFNHREYGDSWCRLHQEIALEMIDRGMYHYGESPCDRAVELIKEPLDKYLRKIPKLPDRVLGDDWRITLAWYTSIRQGKKLKRKDGSPITVADCRKQALAIFREMVKRGFTFNRPESYKKYARELFEWVLKHHKGEVKWKGSLSIELPPGFSVDDIDVDYVNSLSDKELEELWKWLHKKWREEFPDGKTPENYVNANIFIQIERWKRGLIDYDYKDKDKLDEASRYAWQEYGAVTPLQEPEGEYIEIGQAIEAIRRAGVIPIKGQPYAAYLVGRIVNEGKVPKSHDIDMVFRQYPDPRLVRALKRNLPDWLARRIHVVFDPSGPGIGYSVPIYGYALNPLPKDLMTRGFGPYRALEELKTGKYIIGVKPKSGWEKWEFWDVKEAWEKWASEHIDNGIWVEEKVDGRRHQIHVMPNGDVKLFTEDTHRDRAKHFPEIVEEIKSLDIPDSILDGEILAFNFPARMKGKNARAKREIGELVPREDTAVITAGEKIPKEFREKLVLVIYDIMKLKGQDLVDRPYDERRQTYVKLLPRKLLYIDSVRGDRANTMRDFFRLVKKYRSVSGSEGVVCKDAKMKYPVKYSGENRSTDMMKIKNLKEIDVIVLGVKQKKTKEGKPLPTYMYECYIRIPKEEATKWYTSDLKEFNGKLYARIGMSYGTSEKCKIGDIITVMPIRIRFYEKDGKRRVTWMFPWFKEKKPEKEDADPLSVAEKIARLGTGPPPEQLDWEHELETVIRIRMKRCPFYADWDVCPLRKRFGLRRAFMSLTIVEEEVLKYPIMCPLARIYKCPYLKDYYYGYIGIKYYPELSTDFDYAAMLDIFKLPYKLFMALVGKYMECPKGVHDFVMESHILTSKFVPEAKRVPEVGSQHCDWRMSVNGYLVGWSIVGGSVEKMITPKRLLENIGKGFRAETKAKQPKMWLFKDRPIAKGTDWKPNQYVKEMYDVRVGQEGEPRGKMFVMTRGKVVFGAQKPYFHEYFLKDKRYFKDWTRIVVRAVRVPKTDPETKEPIEGQYETLWRVMIPKNQMPYTISDRAMKENWTPPKENPTPFPVEWTKKNWPEQYAKWLKYMEEKKRKLELSNIRYTFSMHSWRGPIHERGMWIRRWYLFLDDKGRGKVRTFRLEGMPPFETEILAWDEGRDNRKYLDWEGTTRPMSRFNPNKDLHGQMKILEKGKVEYETSRENGEEHIILKFKGKGQFFTGTWELIQEEKDSDAYVLRKIHEKALENTYDFVLHKHCVRNKDNCHYDIRIKKGDYLDEFNLYGDIRQLKVGQEVKAHRKTCHSPEKWFITEGKEVKRNIGPIPTWITVLDHGKVQVIEDNPDFVSMYLDSKYFKHAFFIAKRTGEKGYKSWVFRREREVRALAEGNPRTGKPYSPYVIEQKRGWNYFRVYLYDPREFTRAEPQSKVKKYLPDLEIPEGVTIYIGLYPVPGEIHHARVMMVKFDAEKWSKEKAINWIKQNRLEEFESEMIRERRK